MTIEEIIIGCESQNLREQRLLYQRYCKRLYPVCLRYCKDEQSASSALHTGFLKIFNNISSLNDPCKLEAWMQRIIVHASIDQLKADKKFLFVEIDEEHYRPKEVLESDDDGFEKYLPLLKQLPNGYRLVFSMRVLEDMSHQEISKILNISESTSRTQLLKARKMLKSIIEKRLIII